MTQAKGRRARAGSMPVDPSKFVRIDGPSNSSLRRAVIVGWLLSIGAGATIASCAVLPFNPEVQSHYLIAAIIGAAVGSVIYVRTNLRDGRRRREDFVRSGGDPTDMSDMMFGMMRGKRSEEGKWVVPEQGSGDYQGI